MFLFAVAAGLMSTYLFGVFGQDKDHLFIIEKQAGYEEHEKRIPELSEYLENFMLPDNQLNPKWTIGTGKKKLPIVWLTTGVDYDDNSKFPTYRKGLARVAINGEEIRILQNDMQEIQWILIMRGNKSGPTPLDFDPGTECLDPTVTGCSYDIEQVLKRSNFKYQLLCEKKDAGWGKKYIR